MESLPNATAVDGCSPRVTIVGACASGKSSLARALVAAGFAARVCAQEHSEIERLWTHGQPDVLIYLAVDLPSLRQRRDDPTWPTVIYETQLRRLRDALEHCDVYIDTQNHTADEVARIARAGVEAARGRVLENW